MRYLLFVVFLSFIFIGKGQSPTNLKGSVLFPCEYFSFISFALQSDGKIVVCGAMGKEDNTDIFLTRYKSNGTTDSSFGRNGMIYIDLMGYKDIPVSLVVQSNDKILIGAIADNAYSYRTMKGHMMLLRFNPNGIYDETFGNHGKMIEFPERRYKGIMSTKVMDDGSIAVLRRYDYRNQYDFGITKFTPSGSRDSTFGKEGNINGSMRKFDDNGMDLIIQPDGKLVVVGQSHTGPSQVAPGARHNPVDVFIARYLPDGSPDKSFGFEGKNIMMNGSGYCLPRRIGYSPEGRLFITGSNSLSRKDGDIMLYCMEPEGNYDRSFAAKGMLTMRFSSFDEGNDICFLPDGRFFLGGFSLKNQEPKNFIARFHANGRLDTSFAKTGKVVMPFVSENARLAIQPDGKALLGSLATIDRRYYFVLSRFCADGKPDATFGKIPSE